MAEPTAPAVRPGAGVDGPRPPAWRSHARATLSALLLTSRFLPVWLATPPSFVVAALVAPEALQSTSWAFVLPYMTVLAVAALGQMLVIMQAGIDLSIPGVMFLGGNLVLGVSEPLRLRLALAILACIGLGLARGTGERSLRRCSAAQPAHRDAGGGTIVLAFGARYARGVTFESAVPPALTSWALSKPLGISWVFWLGVSCLRCSSRSSFATRPRADASRRSARTREPPGCRAFTCEPTSSSRTWRQAPCTALPQSCSPACAAPIDFAFGGAYLLAPIAAVVIAGASLAGGLASVTSTWVAAFALTFLTQLLLVFGLSEAMQFVVFGAAILAGMIVSGDRIAAGLGKVLQHPRVGALLERETVNGQTEERRRRRQQIGSRNVFS